MTKAEIDRLGHATAGATARLCMSRGKISFHLFVGPCTYAGLVVRSDVVSLPPVDDRSGVLPSVLRREQQVAGRVTIAAVRKGFRQIRSAVPYRMVVARRRPSPGRHEQKLPGSQHVSLVEGEDERIIGVPRGHRPQSRKIGTDGKNVVGRQKRISRIRKGGIEILSASPNSSM